MTQDMLFRSIEELFQLSTQRWFHQLTTSCAIKVCLKILFATPMAADFALDRPVVPLEKALEVTGTVLPKDSVCEPDFPGVEVDQ